MKDMEYDNQVMLIDDAFHLIRSEDKQKWLDSSLKLDTTVHEMSLVSVAEYVESRGIVYKPSATAEDWGNWASRLSLSPVNLVIEAVNFYLDRLTATHPTKLLEDSE